MRIEVCMLIVARYVWIFATDKLDQLDSRVDQHHEEDDEAEETACD